MNNSKYFSFSFSTCRPFTCLLCPLTFITKYRRDRHVRHNHNSTGGKNVQCTICKKFFSSTTSLKVHLLTHTLTYKFRCEYCGKQFLTSGNFKCHVATHTGELPYKCGVCPQAFTSSSSAAVHRRIHKQHNAFKCSFCALTFVNINSLKFHVKADHRTAQAADIK